MRPRIGITSGLVGDHWTPTGASWRAYATAVEQAGGEAVHLDARTLGREAAVLADLNGVLFSGGKDIDLSMYPNPPPLEGETPTAVMARHRMRPEPDRDAYELALLQEALQRDMPVLGICRGCQVMGVGLGGRLLLDIRHEDPSALQHTSHPPPDGASARHPLRIQPGTLLAAVLDPARFQECNSRHHQAVRSDVSGDVRVAAVSPDDGIVEAIEIPGRRWAIGVQWHPEHETDADIREAHAPLFAAFVRSAS